MADIYLHDLDVAESIQLTDLIPFSSDPGGTPASKNITLEDFVAAVVAAPGFGSYLPLAGGTMTGALTLHSSSLLKWGGTASFPALKRSGTELQVRLADDSGYAGINAASYTFSGGASLNYNGSEISSTHRLLSGTGLVSEGYLAIGPWPNYTYLYAAGADIFEQRRTTNAQTLRVYGTYTDASNYVRASLAATSTTVTLAAETAGTGADNVDLILSPAGTGNFKVQTSNGYVTIGEYDVYGNMLITNGASKAIVIGESGTQTILTGASGSLTRFNFFGRNYLNGSTRVSGLLEFGEFGDATSICPALKRSSTELQVRLADDSGYANIRAANLITQGELQTDNPYLYMRIAGSSALILGADILVYQRFLSLGSTGANYADCSIGREAAGVLAQRNDHSGAALVSQTFRIYGARTDDSNYVRASLAATSTSVTLAAETAGTGADNIDLNLVPAGTGQTVVTSLYAHRAFTVPYQGGKMIQVTALDGRTITFGSTVSGYPAIMFGNDLTTNVEANGVIVGQSGSIAISAPNGVTLGASGGFAVSGPGTFVSIGGTSASYPALKRSSTELQVRLADDSGYATTAAGCFTSHGSQIDPQGNGNWMLRHRNSDGGAYWGFSQKNGGTNDIGVFIAGTLTSTIGYKFEAHNTNGGLGWSSSPGAVGPNLVIVRDTTDVVAIYGTTNAALRLYGAYTDGSNFVRASLAATSTSVTLAAQTAGTGADNVDVNITPAGTGQTVVTNLYAHRDFNTPYSYGKMIQVTGDEGRTATFGTFSGQPAIAFGSDLTTNFAANGYIYGHSGCLQFVGGANNIRFWNSIEIGYPATFYVATGGGVITRNYLAICDSSAAATDGADVVLRRDAANTLALRNGSNGQKLRVYGDYTGASQYCALEMSCAQTGGDYFSHYIGPVNAGGGDYWNDNRGEIGGWSFLAIKALSSPSSDAGTIEFHTGNLAIRDLTLGGYLAFFDGRSYTSTGQYGHRNYLLNPNTASHTLGLWQASGHTKSALTVYTNSVLKADITSAGAFRSYGAWTDDSNYVRASLAATSTSVTLAAETAGTGADNIDLNLVPAGTGQTVVTSLYAHRAFTVPYQGGKMIQVTALDGRTITFGSTVSGYPAIMFGNDLTTNVEANGVIIGQSGSIAISAPNGVTLGASGGFAVSGPGTFVSIGGTSASYPALKRSSTELQVRLADDSGYATTAAGCFTSHGSQIDPQGNGYWMLRHRNSDGGAYWGFSQKNGGSNDIGVFIAGTLTSAIGYKFEAHNTNGGLGWSSSPGAAGPNLVIVRDTTDVVAIYGTTNAALRLYGAYTDGSNYVRASLAATSTSVTLAAETAGTGADNVDVYVTPAGSGLVQLGAGANKATVDQFGQVTASGGGTLTSNTSGSFGAFQVCWGNGEGIGYGGTIFRSGFRLTWSQYGNQAQAGHEDTGLARNAAGVVEVNNGTPGTYRDLRLRTITVDAADGNGLQFNGGGSVEAYSNYLTLTSPYAGFAFYSPQVGANVLTTDNTTLNIALHTQIASNKAIYFTSGGEISAASNVLNIKAYTSFVLSTTGGSTRRVAEISNTGELYGFYSYTDASNYQGYKLTSGASSVTLSAETAGTGADDIDLILSPAGAGKVGIGTASPTQLLSVGSVFKVSSTGVVTIKTGGSGLGGNQGLVAADGVGGIALENGTLRIEPMGAASRTTIGNGSIYLGDGAVESLKYDDSTDQFWLSQPLSFAEGNAPNGVYDMIRWGDGAGTSSSNPTYVAVSALKTAANEYGLTFDVSTAATKSERMRLSPTGFLGIGTTSPTAYLDLPASTTSAASLRIRTGTAPTSPNSGDVWHDSTQKTLSYYAAGVAQTVNGVLFTQTQTVTVANTVTETALTGTGTGTLTLPANFFAAGKTIKIRALGYHSSTASPNITIRVKLGSTTILTTGAIASGNGSDDAWVCDAFFTCRTTGGTGTVIGQGYYEEVHGNGNRGGMVNTATTTIDTTASQAISITVEWGTADAGNTISCTNVLIEVLN